MLDQHMLALRTSLVIPAVEDAPYGAARSTAADAVTLDLASSEAGGRRAAARRLAAKYAPAIAAAGRAVHVRISDARSGELAADVAAAVSRDLSAVVLGGAETPQDVRDADVAIRKQEMRLRMVPGSVRLIPEVDSAAGLRALPAILAAVDRHSAVALDAGGLSADLGVSVQGDGVLDYAMWDVAVAARDADVPWVVAAPATTADDRSRLAARAREFGAAGACVAAEAEVRGLNALFTPAPEAVEAARRTVDAWERLRERRGSASGGTHVDRRSVRRARALLAYAAAIERRERAR